MRKKTKQANLNTDKLEKTERLQNSKMPSQS